AVGGARVSTYSARSYRRSLRGQGPRGSARRPAARQCADEGSDASSSGPLRVLRPKGLRSVAPLGRLLVSCRNPPRGPAPQAQDPGLPPLSGSERVMNALAALLTCTLYADDALVHALAETADDNPFAVLDPATDPEMPPRMGPPRTLEAGVARLGDLTARG